MLPAVGLSRVGLPPPPDTWAGGKVMKAGPDIVLAEPVLVHDFPSDQDGKILKYWLYSEKESAAIWSTSGSYLSQPAPGSASDSAPR